MIETLLSAPFLPFSLAFGLLFGLLTLELVFALIGGTLLGAGAEPELDLEGADFGLETGLDAGVDLGADMAGLLDGEMAGLGLDITEFDLPSPEDIAAGSAPTGAAAPGGLMGWLGLGRVPALIWLAAALLAFGTAGYAIQNLAAALFAPLPALLAALPAGLAALWFARGFGAVFARLLPKTETQSVPRSQLGRRRGTITQGTATRGQPAEVRVIDRHGNSHYLRAEPMLDDAAIAPGTDVVVLRHRPTGSFRLIPLGD